MSKKPPSFSFPCSHIQRHRGLSMNFFTILSCWLSPAHCLEIADCSLTRLNSMQCTKLRVQALWRPSETRLPLLAGGACNQWVTNCCSVDLSFLKKHRTSMPSRQQSAPSSTHKWLGDYIIDEQLLFKAVMFGSWYQRSYTCSNDVWNHPKPFSW